MKLEINGYNVFLIVAVTFITSLILVPIIKKVAWHINAIDMPDDTRRIHDKPTPRLGGLAIFLAFLTGYIFFAETSAQMNSILIGSIIIIVIGLIDDINSIKVRYKLLGQIIAAAIVVFYGHIYLPEISAFGLYINFGSWGNPLAVLFIVSIINAINFIDGIDGLSSGTASIYFTTIAILAFILDRIGGLDVILCLIMLGATLGFLVYNFYPASIFIGDVGSMFLGFIISVIALLGFKAATVTSLIVPILILFLPIIDTLFAIIRRVLKGESIGTADKEHIHHQILKLNKSKRKTVLIMYGINIMCAAISVFYALGDNQMAIIFYIGLIVIIMFLILKTDILFKQQKKSQK